MAEIKITKDNFEEEVLNSKIPVLLDFWATWCGPCRMLAPEIEELDTELNGIIKVGKVNVDEEPELSATFGVSSIPLLVYIKNGQVQSSKAGYRPKSDIEKMIEI